MAPGDRRGRHMGVVTRRERAVTPRLSHSEDVTRGRDAGSHAERNVTGIVTRARTVPALGFFKVRPKVATGSKLDTTVGQPRWIVDGWMESRWIVSRVSGFEILFVPT